MRPGKHQKVVYEGFSFRDYIGHGWRMASDKRSQRSWVISCCSSFCHFPAAEMALVASSEPAVFAFAVSPTTNPKAREMFNVK